MELIGKGNERRVAIRLNSYAEARNHAEALLRALQSWNDDIRPDSYTLYCISVLISELLPSEEECYLLDRYYMETQELEQL